MLVLVAEAFQFEAEGAADALRGEISDLAADRAAIGSADSGGERRQGSLRRVLEDADERLSGRRVGEVAHRSSRPGNGRAHLADQRIEELFELLLALHFQQLGGKLHGLGVADRSAGLVRFSLAFRVAFEIVLILVLQHRLRPVEVVHGLVLPWGWISADQYASTVPE